MKVTYHVADFSHGLQCMDCSRVIEDGFPYAERLGSVTDGDVMVDIVCVYCVSGEESS